jgi:hypothetical protein
VLQSEDGAFHSLPREHIRQAKVGGVAFMPQDYGTRLNKQQIDDLVSYLLKNASAAKEAPRPDDHDD